MKFSIQDPVDENKSAVYGFSHIYRINPQWKTTFFVQWKIRKNVL